MTPLCKKSYPALPPPAAQEVLRYAGGRVDDETSGALYAACLPLLEEALAPAVVFRTAPLLFAGDTCSLGHLRVRSRSLLHHLGGCDRVLLFAATIGHRFDRLLSGESRLSPARGLVLDAMGSERVEALCDLFCADMAKTFCEEGYTLLPRFSPGYGDLPLSLGADLLALLESNRSLGLTLTGGGMMLPSKSVSAIVGLKRKDRT